MNKIAVLITCFNRVQHTIKCLDELFQCNVGVDVYLVDDKSTDGTYEKVKQLFPKVILIKGDGNLYWNRGMHLAWSIARKLDYEYYLWLNDDVSIYKNCFSELLSCSTMFDNKVIISGVVETKDKDRVIYGGFDDRKQLITPNGSNKLVTYLNGNIVLVPRYVYNKIGNLDPTFHHDLGDVDYGLRAIETHIKVYTTRFPVGNGEYNNNTNNRLRLQNATLSGRFKKLYSPLGSNPGINYYFRKKHFGLVNALSFSVYLYLINLMPDSVYSTIFKNNLTG